MDLHTMKTQKYIKVGNSTAITVDTDYMRKQNISSGDDVIVRYTDDGLMIVIPTQALAKIQAEDLEKKVETITSKITPELISWTNTFISQNKQALKELANL